MIPKYAGVSNQNLYFLNPLTEWMEVENVIESYGHAGIVPPILIVFVYVSSWTNTGY
jgi:hypothetical protein